MKKLILGLLSFSALTFANLAHAHYYEYCAIGDRSWTCEAAIERRPGFNVVGCIGAYGEPGAIPELVPQNIYRTYVQYGYQQRPRRSYNYVNIPTWYFSADSYDWACTYAAVEVRSWHH